MKKNLKKSIINAIVPVMAVVSVAVPTLEQTAPAFLGSPAVIMEAEAASKRSGKSKAYISKIGFKKNAFTICVNTDAQIDNMTNWLYKISFYTSGTKYSAKICELGKSLVPDFKSKAILTFASGVFKNMSNVGKSAAAARKEVLSLSKKYKSRGIKLTIRENGAWIVETQ